MSTFSINIGTSYESTCYPLVSTLDIETILEKLIDNEEKLITPVKLRDSILSLYSSSGFKVTDTVVSNKEYIGIDTLNPDNRDLKRVIFFGKRSFSGTYSYSSNNDILSTFSFSNYDTDIYFYNTKKDTISNDTTKISILTGTSSALYTSSPYLNSQIVASTSSLVFNIINPSVNGNININSDYGTVSINSNIFPTISQSYGSASSFETLKWENGNITWGTIPYDIPYIGITGSELSMPCSSFTVNGFPLFFSDSRLMPVDVNNLITGTTFSQQSIVNVLKNMLYKYLPPLCSIEILPPYNYGYSEVGTYPSLVLQYSVTKRTLPTNPATLKNMIPGVFAPISDLGQSKKTGTSNGVVITPLSNDITTFQISVSDGTQSASASTTIRGIYPYFYGFSNLNTMNTIGLASLNKLVESKSDKEVSVSGIGNLYFIYDSIYGTLSNIYNPIGNTVSGSFSYTTQIFSSPTGLWAAKQFYVYKWSNSSQIGPPPTKFQFKY